MTPLNKLQVLVDEDNRIRTYRRKLAHFVVDKETNKVLRGPIEGWPHKEPMTPRERVAVLWMLRPLD